MDSLFRCRINNVDHYQAVPNPDFDPPLPLPDDALASNTNKDVQPRISVLRVFGATPTGQRVLLHIHGMLQYTYVEYTGSLLPQDVSLATRTLQLSIDAALATSYRQNVYDSKNKYVAHISLVKGIPFYGYHVGYKFYLKIYLLNPLHMTRLADLLREGAVMKRVLQPYESHMQYIAQWMCDYNLYGCAYLDCEKVKFRAPVPNYEDLIANVGGQQHEWHDRSIDPEWISDETACPKQSYCALEVDIKVEDIVNRHDVLGRNLHHDFIERIAPLPLDKKLVASMAGLWRDETKRRKRRMGLTTGSESEIFGPEVMVSMSHDPRNVSDGGWIHEAEFKEKIVTISEEENARAGGKRLTFDAFLNPDPLEDTVQTALESVEDLYSWNIRKLLETRLTTSATSADTQAIVDETVINQDNPAGSGNEDLTSSKTLSCRNSIKNGTMLSSSSASLNSEVKTPISSSEFAAHGVRPLSEIEAFEGDDFPISKDFLSKEKPKKPNLKRRHEDRAASFSIKRPRFLDEVYDNDLLDEADAALTKDAQILHDQDYDSGYDEQLLEDLDPVFLDKEADEDPERARSESESLLKPLAHQMSQDGRLSFPVVKDPNNPNTLKRLSQQSGSPEKRSVLSNMETPLKVGSTSQLSPLRTTVRKTSVKGWSPAKPEVKIKGFDKPRPGRNLLICALPQPPSAQYVTETLWAEGLPNVIYQDAYYSNERDVPEKSREYAGKDFKLESTTVPYLPDFDPTGTSSATFGQKQPVVLDQIAEDLVDRQNRQRCTHMKWSIAKPPPSRAGVTSWLEQEQKSKKLAMTGNTPARKRDLSQIEGATQNNAHGFKYSQKKASTSVQHETQYMSVMSLEVHVNTRGHLAPNPEEDSIACIFWCVQGDNEELKDEAGGEDGYHSGVLVLSEDGVLAKQIASISTAEVEHELSELEVLTRIVDIVRYYDPDILTGYEVHNSSWGYLIERARLKYDLNLCDDLSRLKSQSHGRFGKDDDRWGFNHTSTIRITGRHTINIWRAMRGELNLLQYTLENVVFHVLHKRVPHYSFADLTRWYQSANPRDLSKIIDYFAGRTKLDLQVLDANELVPRTSEQARLIGIDWFAVVSRGSQFKVENIMFRIAKPENLILPSPSRRQVGGQNALECLPLVMEPQSDFYTSPMLVLDFQSLYPSVMIAYNYCYSTFLGRVISWRGINKMGFTTYQRQERLIELLKDHINIAPNGIMYTKQHIRRSLLAKMLSELLETRVMVKSGMKQDKEDKTLQKLLNNRQLALKLIANVTYGYTSASFSGRMPCSEIADSIVQTGRETLERAIAVIHGVTRWGAEVVYGDTDSLFIHLKGRTRQQAFTIGNEIAQTITNMNPRPIKLKFEKVYQPCVLLAKKRYVGFKYESPDQLEPVFEAKGIETVRRDGTPAEQKIEENALKVLFRTADLSKVKSYFQAQCSKIMRGKVSVQDFCFAREVKLGTYSDRGPPPPGALISARKMLADPRSEPQYGERVPYVVVTGGPGARLIDRCVAPEVLLSDAQQELDAEYYISKNIIPPLERIFNLVGANVRGWFDEMPKVMRVRQIEGGGVVTTGEVMMNKKTLESYMKSSNCVVCHDIVEGEVPLCYSCAGQADRSLLVLRGRMTRAEKKMTEVSGICRDCSGITWAEEVKCESKDCPVFYGRVRQRTTLKSLRTGTKGVMEFLEDGEEGEGLEW